MKSVVAASNSISILNALGSLHLGGVIFDLDNVDIRFANL